MADQTHSEKKEQELRREAIRRRLAGERVNAICQELGRSREWFHKWWHEYWDNDNEELVSHSRAPHDSPQRTLPEMEATIVALRHELEAGDKAQYRYGLIGAQEIQRRLVKLKTRDVPSASTIQRILARHGLTQGAGEPTDRAYYPWLPVEAAGDLYATDIVVRYVRGGQAIHNFHTLDVFTQRVCADQFSSDTSVLACQHLKHAWKTLGVPHFQQLDNEAAFCGGHTHKRIIGKVVRLCLLCGIEPVFTPYYEAERNYYVENFHRLWDKAFWSRTEFKGLTHVQTEMPPFLHWYRHTYQPPALHGRTVAQASRGLCVHRLLPDSACLIPDYHADRLPITAGFIHFMRQVEPDGVVSLLNDHWHIGRRWHGQYVRATIHIAQHQLSFWHKLAQTRPRHALAACCHTHLSCQGGYL